MHRDHLGPVEKQTAARCCKKCNVFSWSWRRCSSSGTMTAWTYCAVGCCCWKRWSIAGTVNNDQNASLWTSGMPNFMSSTNGIGLSKSCCRLAMLCTNWQMLCAVGKVYMPYSPRMVSRLSCSWMVKLEKSASDLSSTVQSMSSRNNLHYICSTVYASHKCLGLTWWNIRLLQQLLSHCDRQWFVIHYVVCATLLFISIAVKIQASNMLHNTKLHVKHPLHIFRSNMITEM